MGFGRILDIIFFIYFATHIPITICIDLQAICPAAYFHQSVGFESFNSDYHSDSDG